MVLANVDVGVPIEILYVRTETGNGGDRRRFKTATSSTIDHC